MPPGSSIDNQH